MNSNPFISIDYWVSKSNLIIDATFKNRTNNYNYEKEIKEVFNNHKIPIIFLKTDLIINYVDILSKIENKFILITGSNDDHCAPFIQYPCENNDFQIKVINLLEKDNLLVWLCKNPCITHDKLKGYPLGPKWQWKTTRFFGEDKTKHLEIFHNHCLKPLENLKNTEKELFYLNFSQTTGKPLYDFHRNIRRVCLEKLKKHFKYNDSSDFETYIKNLNKFKFVASPPGRGIDTHRTWESLMCGCIPIVMSGPHDYLFENLPVVIINDWDTINEDYLQKIYPDIIKKDYDYSIVYTAYWDKYIENIILSC